MLLAGSEQDLLPYQLVSEGVLCLFDISQTSANVISVILHDYDEKSRQLRRTGAPLEFVCSL